MDADGEALNVLLDVFQFRRPDVGVGSIDENSAMMIENDRSFADGWHLWIIQGWGATMILAVDSQSYLSSSVCP